MFAKKLTYIGEILLDSRTIPREIVNFRKRSLRIRTQVRAKVVV